MAWKDQATRRTHDRTRRLTQSAHGLCIVFGCHTLAAAGRKQCQEHLDRLVVNTRKRKYGLTIEQFAALIERQGNACAICRVVPERFHVDHDHKTGAVRGLLCASCNKALGAFKDNAQILEAAIVYLTAAREAARP